MRIPISIACLLCLLAVGITWWLGIRNKDFLMPPADIMVSDSTLPPSIATPPASPPITIQKNANASPPVEDKQNKQDPVALDTFADQAAMGPAHLIQLADGLEDAKFHQLAWLAWERVLDATSPTLEEITQARTAIRRLRVRLHDNLADLPQSPITITLQAGTASQHVEAVQPILEECARQIETASSGILRVRSLVTGSSDLTQTASQGPVAVWLAGADAGSRSSEVLSFTLQPGLDVKQNIESSTSQLLRNLVLRSLTPPPAATPEMSFADELSECFTRRAWLSVGTFLSLPVEGPP